MNRWLASLFLFLNQCLITLSKGLFAYQIALQAKPLPTLDSLLQQAHRAREKRLLEDTGDSYG